jgi:hypothetical protein
MSTTDWIVLLLCGAAFTLNGINRVRFNRLWGASPGRIQPPEQLFTYDENDLHQFVAAARDLTIKRSASGHPTSALAFYVRNLLAATDLCYALALSLATVYLWWIIVDREGLWQFVGLPRAWPWVSWLAIPCGAMAVIYCAADICEDLKLAAILWHGKLWYTTERIIEADGSIAHPDSREPPPEPDASHPIDRAEAAAANMLTRIKMLTLSLSLIGVAIHFALAGLQRALQKALSGSSGTTPGGTGVVGAA